MECIKCKKEKPLEKFSKKYQSLCTSCMEYISHQRYRQSDKGKILVKRANDKPIQKEKRLKKYRENPEFRKKEIQRRIAHQKANPKIKAREEKKIYHKNLEKSRARGRLKMAVYRGKIIKPKNCVQCNVEAKRIEAHHTDYSKPFEVLWLCTECHKRIHGKI
jgi:hypothetical protein